MIFLKRVTVPSVEVFKLQAWDWFLFSTDASLPIASDRLNRSENRSVHPPCLRYRSPLNVRSEQIGMENRSDFIPTTEFLKSEIGIPVERNFPAGIFEFILTFILLSTLTCMILETIIKKTGRSAPLTYKEDKNKVFSVNALVVNFFIPNKYHICW